ncbi:MAG TPA: hypothetical protein VFM14_13150 [Gemmatimonadales bacterium]|nr:hypothetical protein [Gemmatimonadales bacterium]
MYPSLIPIALVALAGAPDNGRVRRAPFDASDVLGKMRTAYEALSSYADSGTVLDESTGFTDRSTFRTFFTREPNNLFIEFRGIASEYKIGNRVPLNAHIVLWMENGELQTWSGALQAHETYPRAAGQQVNAVKNAGYYTAGISVLIPSHLYGNAGLASAVHAAEDVEADGFETVHGRKCYRLLGVERWRYPSGQETGVRAITIWIDAETYLIHKVFQDTPKGHPRNEISRRTTTIKHRANPKLEPAQFRYTVPAS